MAAIEFRHVRYSRPGGLVLDDFNLAVESGEAGTYLYEPSGIRERSGYIPIWLKLVSFGLILWGLYYAIRYWSSY